MKKIIMLLSIGMLCSCGVNNQDAINTLTNAGYHDVQIGGYAWIGCSNSDYFASHFTAVSNSTDKPVSGVLCSGMLKGMTIRFD